MNLALKITLFRVCAAPVFVFLFVMSEGSSKPLLWSAIFVAALIEISDAIDGEIARRYNHVTDIGKILDPLADSLSRISCFLAFFKLEYAHIAMIMIFFYRDSIVSTIRILAASRNHILGARSSGKIKAIAQAIAIFGVLLTLLASAYGIPLYFETGTIITAFMSFAVIVTLYSLIDYIWGSRHFISALLKHAV
jgi:CDP-diacylglycerol--glycerol-3-phosphate 3-phosphatidyltransferase